MNDIELNEMQEETELPETEQAPNDKSTGKRVRWNPGILCVVLGLLAGVLTWILVLLTDSENGTGLVCENWIFLGYLYIIPLILMGVACGIPYYRHKNIVAFELFINAILWTSGLYYVFAYFCRL